MQNPYSSDWRPSILVRTLLVMLSFLLFVHLCMAKVLRLEVTIVFALARFNAWAVKLFFKEAVTRLEQTVLRWAQERQNTASSRPPGPLQTQFGVWLNICAPLLVRMWPKNLDLLLSLLQEYLLIQVPFFETSTLAMRRAIIGGIVSSLRHGVANEDAVIERVLPHLKDFSPAVEAMRSSALRKHCPRLCAANDAYVRELYR